MSKKLTTREKLQVKIDRVHEARIKAVRPSTETGV
jgi:hypothetical protein